MRPTQVRLPFLNQLLYAGYAYGTGEYQGHTQCTGTPCTLPSVHCGVRAPCVPQASTPPPPLPHLPHRRVPHPLPCRTCRTGEYLIYTNIDIGLQPPFYIKPSRQL